MRLTFELNPLYIEPNVIILCLQFAFGRDQQHFLSKKQIFIKHNSTILDSPLLWNQPNAFDRGVDPLPDVPIQMIFENLPLVDLVNRIPQVCSNPNWKELQKLSCLKRTHLSLLVNDPETLIPQRVNNVKEPSLLCLKNAQHLTKFTYGPEFKPDFPGTVYTRLVLSKFSRQAVRDLIHLFPRVKTLEIAIFMPDSSSLVNIVYLLEQWSGTLINLKLWSFWDKWEYQKVKRANFNILFKAINNLGKLKELTFYANTLITKPPGRPPFVIETIDMPILAKLKVFKFYSMDLATIFFDSLTKVC